MEIQTVHSLEQLKMVFDFLSSLFYEESIRNQTPYFPMGQRYEEMQEQFYVCSDFLLYVEEKGEIVAALTTKGMNVEKKKITVGILGVDEACRHQDYGKALVDELEKRCMNAGITKIDLGARISACPFYLKLGYKPQLMVQVYDFVKIDAIRQANIVKLKEMSSYQSDTYGFIIFETDVCNPAFIQLFTSEVKTADAQFIFHKKLEQGE